MSETKRKIVSENDEILFSYSDPVQIRMPSRFSQINRMVLQDLNKGYHNHVLHHHHLHYDKERIMEFLRQPQKYEHDLRQAVIYLYGASSHFRRLIQYFAGLSDLSYVVSPYKLDTTTAKPTTIKRNYRRVLNLLSAFDIKNQGEKILTVCLREDVFYGTIHEGADSSIIQQLPSDFCKISIIEDNVPNVSFNFSYFDAFPDFLQYYPEEFSVKYELYKADKIHRRWQELDAPNSFAVKANKDILAYAVPPFAGILRELYDLEDYRALKLAKTELENYAILVMQLGCDEEGNYQMNYQKAVEFWQNLDHVLPEEVGSVLSPMPIEKISFERNHTGDTDSIAQAEENLFTAAGVSSLLFNNARASASSLLLSIKADQAITYSIVKSIEAVLNRYIHRHSFGKNFKCTFLDCSPFNRKELTDIYLKGAQYGLPMVHMYAAAQGLAPDDIDGMNFLEDEVLQLKGRLVPLQSSNTQSANGSNLTPEDGGRPQMDVGELTDAGDISRERGEA